MTISKIAITYDGETIHLTCDLAQATSPLTVDGHEIGRQVADARHRTPDAVRLAAAWSWPEVSDWSEGSEAWEALEYETVEPAADLARHDWPNIPDHRDRHAHVADACAEYLAREEIALDDAVLEYLREVERLAEEHEGAIEDARDLLRCP